MEKLMVGIMGGREGNLLGPEFLSQLDLSNRNISQHEIVPTFYVISMLRVYRVFFLEGFQRPKPQKGASQGEKENACE